MDSVATGNKQPESAIKRFVKKAFSFFSRKGKYELGAKDAEDKEEKKPEKDQISLTDFTQNLQEYFDEIAKEIKADKKGEKFTPEQRAMFLEFQDHLKACKSEIGKIEQEVFAEFEKEKAAAPEGIKNLSKEQIAQILESKKRAKMQSSEIARTLFVMACASDIKISKCLEFAEQMGVKDLSSFDLNTGLSPLAAAMLRRKNNVAAMKQLQKAGADISAVALDGKNIAHMAALFGVNKDVIKYLATQGKGVNLFNVKDKNGFTALDIAIGRRNAEFIKYLQKEADAKFAFTPKDVQAAALAGDEAVEELARSRVLKRRTKGKSQSGLDEEDVSKEQMNAVLKALERPLFDVTTTLSGSLKNEASNFKKEVVEIADNKSVTPPAPVATADQPAQQVDGAAALLLSEKVAAQKKKLQEQEQVLRLLHQVSPEDKAAGGDGLELLRELTQGIAAIAHAVNKVAEAVSNKAEEITGFDLNFDGMIAGEERSKGGDDGIVNKGNNNSWSNFVLSREAGGAEQKSAGAANFDPKVIINQTKPKGRESWQESVRPQGPQTDGLNRPPSPPSQGRSK